jgi:hypothetical protein
VTHLQEIAGAAKQADIPETTLYLVELCASQINGCGVCVDIPTGQRRGSPSSTDSISTATSTSTRHVPTCSAASAGPTRRGSNTRAPSSSHTQSRSADLLRRRIAEVST